MCPSDAADPATELVDRGAPSPPADPALIDDLVLANRILFRHRVVDAFGHVSVRHPASPERFLLARNMAPGNVTAADLVEFDLDGHPVTAAGRKVYLERFIHSAIYKARPDVMSIVHSHAHATVPFGVVSQAALRPIWHMSWFLAEKTPVFEISDAVGDGSDMLIRTAALGDALAASLGAGSVVLMRGHGATAVGPSLRHAVYHAVYLQLNAELQLKTAVLGEARYLSPAEVAAARVSVGSQLDRAWNLWASEVA
ncbi:MAG: class II aldolase/adducin family protein [Burkholderiaceae bacterium]